jgi:hypothetical protein
VVQLLYRGREQNAPPNHPPNLGVSPHTSIAITTVADCTEVATMFGVVPAEAIIEASITLVWGWEQSEVAMKLRGEAEIAVGGCRSTSYFRPSLSFEA